MATYSLRATLQLHWDNDTTAAYQRNVHNSISFLCSDLFRGWDLAMQEINSTQNSTQEEMFQSNYTSLEFFSLNEYKQDEQRNRNR